MKLYETFELEFAGEELSENWASVDVTAVFTNGDTQVTTKGFYAGDGVYKVRFLPEKRKWREQGEKMFGHLKESLSEAELDALNRKDMDFKGHLDERVFLVYLGRRCNAQLPLRLPKGRSYRIEVIDVWNMTRETVMTGVSGAVNVKLPGREGMAVMAVAESV